MKIKLLFLLAILFVSQACQKEIFPYSIFQYSTYKDIDTGKITLPLDSSHDIIIKNGYQLSSPKYFLKKNNEEEFIINDSNILSVESHGWNGREELKFENVRIHLIFDKNNFKTGDILKIISRHSNFEAFKIIEVQ
jgi:hypothetical protein